MIPLSKGNGSLVEGLLTPRQAEVLRCISRWIQRKGTCPTYREIAGQLNMHSLNGVFGHLTALERKGYLRHEIGKSRSIVLLQEKRGWEPPSFPVLGTIREDRLIFSSEHSLFQRSRKKYRKYPYSFYLEVEKGVSFHQRAKTGDRILVESNHRLEENRTGIFITPNNTVIVGKYFYHPASGKDCIQLRESDQWYWETASLAFLGYFAGLWEPVE
ncbi:MAG: hypothetical protein Q4E67_03045 [Planctomycetia bacterium]|nr:hypothetical protein [Planctomycetia bacterium]